MSNEMLKKVLDTTDIGNGNAPGQGGLTYAQADRFIDYMFDATVLGNLVRTRRMRAAEEEIDTIHVGQRIVRAAHEAVDTGENVGPTFGKISITVKKLRVDWELSTESLEDNIEGEELEDHIARMIATAAGNDLEDLAINGDTDSTDAFYQVFDGWNKIAREDGHVVDAEGEPISRALFNRALKAVPRKFMARRNQLRFFTGSNMIQDYLFSLQQAEDGFVNPESAAAAGINRAVRTEGPAGFLMGAVFGVPVQEVPLFNEQQVYGTGPDNDVHGDIWLTYPDNLIWAVKRDITIHREFKPKKDTIEYTLYVRTGVQVEVRDAFVVVRNVGPAED